MSFGDPVVLEPDDVPTSLRYLIPLVRRWGIGDNGYRDEAVRAASREDRLELVQAVQDAPEALWTWLTGSETQASRPTEAYVAFTCLTMAFDLARLLTDREIAQEPPGSA